MSGDEGPNGIHAKPRGALVVGLLVGLDDVAVGLGLAVGELLGDLVGDVVGDVVGVGVRVPEGPVAEGDVGSVVDGDGFLVEVGSLVVVSVARVTGRSGSVGSPQAAVASSTEAARAVLVRTRARRS